MARASIVYPYIDMAKLGSGSLPQTFDLIIIAHVTKVCQNSAFIVFGSHYPISFVQIHLGVPANNDSATAVEQLVRKPKSYPAGASRNDYGFHVQPLLAPIRIAIKTCNERRLQELPATPYTTS
jgi:hypothetical protein